MEDQKETKATKETKFKSVLVDSVKFIHIIHIPVTGKAHTNHFMQATSDGFTIELIELLESGFIKLSRKGNANFALVPLSNVANINIKG